MIFIGLRALGAFAKTAALYSLAGLVLVGFAFLACLYAHWVGP